MMNENTKYNPKDKKIWEQVFSKIPEEWKKHAPSSSMLDCLERFKKHDVQSVLDLGCGVGIWSIFLGKKGFSIKGLDFSKNAIDFANNWAKEESVDALFECSSLVSHPFKKETFDGVIASKILDNISRIELLKVSKQIQLNLKDGGILYSVFNPYLIEADIEKLKKRHNPTKGITHIVYQNEELRELFPNLTLLEFKIFEHGFRGLIWKKT
ncbi:class I SAM-dependent methyltransferase [Changchengzhania lutea]|uniref:class I SAM-dependent methyltransferase n=1 Tax=Changchengzhania lutea TaxID=2049305 RepID=UPI00115E8258|nr:class I SAM-dependent methyltransferase [Changchengzhania lutea]